MKKQTRRAREMARVVARWERSGLTQAAFARQCGMSVHTFTWWRHRLRAAGRPAGTAAPGFTEVVLAAAPGRGAPHAEVELRNGRVVRLPLVARDPAALRALLAVLDPPC
jgi:hypothetical protein